MLVNIQTWEKVENPVSRATDLANGYIDQNWWPELRLDMSLQGVAADFYLFYAVKDGDDYLRQRFEEYAQVVAKQIAVYLDAAIGGELRHKGYAGMIKDWNRAIARRDWRMKRLDKGHSLLQGGRSLFYNVKWRGAYGGPKWGKIADLLVKHLSGELSPTLFVDQAFALQHNTGTVFNKIDKYWNQNNMKQVLDANLQEDWEKLLTYGSGWAREMFISWLKAEEVIEVEGIEHSRPRKLLYEVATAKKLYPGAIVRVGHATRSNEWRGKQATIICVNDDNYYAQIKRDGRKNILVIHHLEIESTADSSGLEYIG